MKHTRLVLAALALAAPAIVVACVLADPPPIGQPGSLAAPSILVTSVAPPLNQKITQPPTNTPLTFSVPVLIPPDQAFKFRVFIDLVDSTPSPPTISVADDGGTTGTLPDAGDSVHVCGFEFPTSTFDPSVCHKFTFVVAYEFLDNQSPNPLGGGDRVDWFYEPIADCTYYDAAPPTYDASDGASE